VPSAYGLVLRHYLGQLEIYWIHMAINLIPPQKKKDQQTKEISKLLISSFVAILIMTLIIFSALYAINHLAEAETTNVKKQLYEEELEIKKLKDVEDKVNLINDKLSKVDSLKKQNISFSEVLKSFNISIPEQVHIISLGYDRKTKKISISGDAETRKNIVDLQNMLEKSEFFNKMSFSSSVYNQTNTTYTFSMTGEVEK